MQHSTWDMKSKVSRTPRRLRSLCVRVRVHVRAWIDMQVVDMAPSNLDKASESSFGEATK